MSSARLTWTERASAVATPTGVMLIVALAAVAIAYGPLVIEHFTLLSALSYYQHFPFILAAFGWLVWQRFTTARDEGVPRERRWAGPAAGTLLVLAWLTLAVAYIANSPLLAYVSLVILTGSVLMVAAHSWQVEGLTAVWLLLWLLARPPFHGDQKLIAYLQRLSSRASSFVLDFLGVSHLMEGNMLTLPGKQFFVDEACSGIISVMSIIACAAIYGVWRRSTATHVVALIAAGVAWATVMNTFRITSIAYLYARWGVDWSEGTPHELLSLVVFMLTFLALISSDVLLRGLLAPVGPAWEEHHNESLQWGGWLARGWDALLGQATADQRELSSVSGGALEHDRFQFRLPAWPLQAALLTAFLALPAWSLARAGQHEVVRVASEADREATLARAVAIQQPFLPAQLGALRQERFDVHERARDDEMGNHSRSHTFVDDRGNTYLVSCDFAYEDGWHELTWCYQGVGWVVDDRAVFSDDPTTGAAWPRMEASFSKDGDVARAFVVASAFNESGTLLNLPSMSFWENLRNALTRKREVRSGELAFQTQVWVTSSKPIEEFQRDAARRLHAAARARFRELVIATGVETGPTGVEAITPVPTIPVAPQ